MSILLVGTGPMAEEYARVLLSMQLDFLIVGRGQASAERFSSNLGKPVFTGGLSAFLDSGEDRSGITHAIVATGVEQLAGATILLGNVGISNILVEKPAGLTIAEVGELGKKVDCSKVFVGYNRRFYSSVVAARNIIQEDGGVKSFSFEFTEWANDIEKVQKADGVKENWFLANSTHVVDLAFHLGGIPAEISSFVDGGLSWHEPSMFAGAGKTITGALFSYSANWEAPGRWAVEILTSKRRLYLKPMENLSVQFLNSVQVTEMQLDDDLDKKFKPGLYKMVSAFLSGGNNSALCSLCEHIGMLPFYSKIANY